MSSKRHELINLIYHNKDADGFLSMELFKKFINVLNSVSSETHIGLMRFGYNYENQIQQPDIYSQDNRWLNIGQCFGNYVFIDCTPPIWWLEEVRHRQKVMNVTIVDHHKNACENIEQNFEFVNLMYNSNISASMILYKSLYNVSDNWQYILDMSIRTTVGKVFKSKDIKIVEEHLRTFLNNPIFSKIVNLVNSYDVWDWINDFRENKIIEPYLMYRGITEEYSIKDEFGNFDGKPYLEYAFSLNITYDKAYEKFIERGNELYAKEMSIHKLSKFYKCNYNNSYFGAIINGSVNFFTSEKLLKVFDFVIYCDKIEDVYDLFKIGVRSNEVFDSSSFVKNICNGKGGGHKQAAGGSLTTTEFIDMFKTMVSDNVTSYKVIDDNSVYNVNEVE